MRVLITGGAGLLGSALIRAAPQGVELHATRRTAPVAGGAREHVVDLTDAAATAALLDAVRPELVIHTAYRQDTPERDVWRATEGLVLACRAAGAALIHLSSDVVFDGENAPYAESAATAPVHEYGRWKAQAERFVREQLPAAAIVRTSLITRADPPDTISARLIDGIRDAARGGETPRLFVDELRCPIGDEDLAAQLWELAEMPPDARAGFWHLAGPEAVSRYTLGVLVAGRHGVDASAIVPTRSRGAGLQRPRDLRLLTTRAERELRTFARPISEVLFPADEVS